MNLDLDLDLENEALAKVVGQISPRQGRHLTWLAAQVEAEHCIVETGAYRGLSSCYLGLGAKGGNRARIYSIDLWGMRKPGDEKRYGKYLSPDHLAAWCRNTAAVGVAELVTPVQSYSVEAAKLWTRPIGLLFIDGDHSHTGCLGDYEGFAPHIVAGGSLAVHDFANPALGVGAVVDEIIRPSGLWEDEVQLGGLVTWRRK